MEARIVLALPHDGHVAKGRVQIVDMGRGADEVVFHHQERINGLMDACRSEGMARQGFRGADGGHVIARENFLDRFNLPRIAHRRGSAVGIDVVDRMMHVIERLMHAAHRALT